MASGEWYYFGWRVFKRQQFVKMGDFHSLKLDIACGVPQGSVLGPKLFILHINEINNVSKVVQFVLFADDTNIFSESEILQQLMGKLPQNWIKKGV